MIMSNLCCAGSAIFIISRCNLYSVNASNACKYLLTSAQKRTEMLRSCNWPHSSDDFHAHRCRPELELPRGHALHQRQRVYALCRVSYPSAHACTHARTHARKPAYQHAPMKRHASTHVPTNTHEACTRTHTLTHTQAHTRKYTHASTHTHKRARARSHAATQPHEHAHPRRQACMQTHERPRSCPRRQVCMQTHARTPTRTESETG